MILAILGLTFGVLIGLAAAVYNLNDEEGRRLRLEARRAQRKRRAKPMWYIKYEDLNKRSKDDKRD